MPWPTQVEQDLGRPLLELWPNYVGHVASVLAIGVLWIDHHPSRFNLAGTEA
jgi:hypothetical protein